MPFINYTSSDYNEWMNSDIKQWGARLHPLGEKSIFDFFIEATGDIASQRLRLLGVQILIVVHIIMFCIFSRNLIIASRMVISRPRSIVSWCCFLPSVLSSLIILAVISMYVDSPINCRIMIWILTFNISFAMVGNGLILLQKVYLVLCRQKWILYISIPIMISQLAFPFLLIYLSFSTLEEKIACLVFYPQFILWYWFVINVPINVLFSAIFCYIALKQYRLFGSEAWKQLARDGIQTMLLATSCNIICSIFVIVYAHKVNADTFFVIDSVVVTTILINHCQKFGKTAKFNHRPKTDNILNLSQIVTAKSEVMR
ncbi:hypothetical protein BDF19DRAFT_450642 [Syncephalis fuscata]|nr:hypothetical protein BDF19DRAFT_450642 [Syncephalis fuscata]